MFFIACKSARMAWSLEEGGGWEIVYRGNVFGIVRINDAKSKSLVERVANDPCHMVAS
jgi:hypothetical protein